MRLLNRRLPGRPSTSRVTHHLDRFSKWLHPIPARFDVYLCIQTSSACEGLEKTISVLPSGDL